MEKRYPLSKEELSLYLACTLNPERRFAYLLGWSVELPAQADLSRLEDAIRAVFRKHRILNARIGRASDGSLYKFDDGAEPVIERFQTEKSPVVPEDYYWDVELDGGRLYRALLVETPASVEVLLLFHHIILDGTARQVLVRDFEKAYQGKPIGEEALTAFAYAAREAQQEKGAAFEEDRAYYRALLDGVDGEAPDPDRNGETERFGRSVYPLTRISGAAVRGKKQRSGVRTSTIFLGALGWALAKLEGTARPVIASAMSGRTEELSESCGMFVRTLPMVCFVRDDRTVDDYLRELDRQTTENRAHSLYTYLDMTHELGLQMRVCFAYQGDMIADRVCFDGEERRMGFLRASESDYELRLYLWRKDGEYVFEALYRADHYSPELIDCLARTFEQALSELLARENMAELQAASPEQLAELDRFNDTATEYDRTGVVSQFRARAAEKPDNTAVVFGDLRLSYREADERSERVAACLHGRGIGAGDVVSVLIPRGEYMVLASLGVLKSGAAYQPLDPSYPPERLRFMVEDAGAKLLIADRALMSSCLPDCAVPALYLDELPALPAPAGNLPAPKPEDLFILLYTSGTTGVPKGVMLEHRNLACYAAWYRRYYGLSEKSRVAAYASYGFDACMMDLYPALTAGAAVVIVPEELRLDMAALERYFEANGVTNAFMTTQVGRHFAQRCRCSTLRHLSVGGERLAPVLPAGDFAFHNIYGPTECTVNVTSYPVRALMRRLPIGRAVDNTRLYVVDAAGRRLPAGCVGELWIAGHQVGRGYLNRPEKTAEAFLPNPFTDEPGYERVYRTGDVVRLLPDGNVDFIGRNDGQVKIRGFRIELSEVEEVIRSYPGIRDATVQAFDDPGGGKMLAAYLVSDEKVDIAALHRFIRGKKPPYMVPECTMQIDAIPLNQNQKVDRRALPEPVPFVEPKEEEAAQRPMTRLEEEIAALVKRFTGDVEPGIGSSLLYYGVDSLDTLQLAALLEDRFGVEIPAVRLLDGASILDIENLISEHWLSGHANAPAEADASGRTEGGACPLSAMQLGVYYDVMKREDELLYNIPMCFAFASVDAARLAGAVRAAVAAHPCLNTQIELRGGALCQIPADREPAVEELEMTEAAFRAYREDFVRPFDLRKAPLYRFAVVRTEARCYLLWDIHHIVFDGYSSGVLLREIDRAYRGEAPEGEAYTYYDYAREQEALRHGPEYREAEAWVAKLLEKFEAVSEIPPDKAGNAADGLIGEQSSAVPCAAVDEFCRKNGVTASSLFLAATFYAVSRFSGGREVYLTTISTGRESRKTQKSLGMFVHTLPLALTLSPELNALELIRRSGDTLRESVRHELFPFPEIAARWGYSADLMFEYQVGISSAKGSLGGCPYESLRMKLEAPKFKTAVVISMQDGSYVVTVRYNDALYTPEYMETLAQAVRLTAEGLMDAPEAPVRSLEMLDAAGREQLKRFGETQRCELPHKLLHRAFEAAAERYPERTALIARDAVLTFRELNEKANAVARALMERGVGRGDSIVLLLPRKSWFFAALFGVLKAGAAFVPCDPEYPPERIAHILSDADARYILTTDEHLSEHPAGKALRMDGLLAGAGGENPDVEVSPGDLAYMIYTSGSTGRPKGVELTHLGICNYIHPAAHSPYFRYVEQHLEKMVSVTTVSFDMMFKDTVGILCAGRTVVFTDEEQMNDPRALAAVLRETGADAFSATPSRLMQYLEYGAFRDALSQCKMVISGAEQYPRALLDRLRGLGIAHIFNSYGPTEITVSSNMAELTNADHISIGRPLPNYREFIVDEDGNLLPPGVTGELYIGGPGVARGYRNLPELTERSFVTFRGERVYRTGDYAKWDREGNVLVLGRRDNQVKLRGLRIELGEIEGLMEAQPGIRKAVAVIRKLNGQDHLCAYFTAETKIDVPALRDALAERLTRYMVPDAFTQLDAIPLTPNGKLDRRALPEPVMLERGEYVPPANEAEACFCEIFQNTLHLERVGANDDFFAIGGTSLIAATVVVEASERGYELGFGDLFRDKTPRALAARLRGDGESASPAAADFGSYDYAKINALLAKNTLESFRTGSPRPLGDILLTGATGFMGVHVLAEYLRSESGTAYCLTRKGRYSSADKRLKNTLFYYFGDAFDAKTLERVRAVEGDLTDPAAFDALAASGIGTVFNCAANVKHFSGGTDIEDINVGGAKNCVRFCEKTGARLVHFSTVSVAGALPGDAATCVLDERSLYFGQILNNQYTASKMLAERKVLEAVAERGLDAKIIRVGTLAARESDGEFQMNFLSNSFMERLRSYRLLGCFPYSGIGQMLRLGPIDATAAAILPLARTPRACCLFNLVNSNPVPILQVILTMRACGLDIALVEDSAFEEALREAEKDPKKAAILESLLAYRNLHGTSSAKAVEISGSYTAQVLARLGFFWKPTGEAYIRRFLEALAGLGFFDEAYLHR